MFVPMFCVGIALPSIGCLFVNSVQFVYSGRLNSERHGISDSYLGIDWVVALFDT